jgi:hypothetical protein
MAEQLPIPVGAPQFLPPLSIDGDALYEFSRDLNDRLRDLEHRFYQPRINPRLFFGQPRMAPAKPR